MEKVEIVKELEELALKIEKRYNRGGSFSPFRYYKYEDGKNVPVYFIGAPGLAVAFSATLVAALLFILITLPFKLYYWIPFVIFVAFIMRLAVKIDKARQIRSFCANIVLRAIKSIKKYNEEGNKEYLKSAVEFLREANKWVNDKNIETQLSNIDKVLKSVKE
ncbi:hypothetical protein FHQ18_06150 [Deferribacter autotrophicus]|uniref:Uncharacterized protein n=1 Tax=Deferribacter autotrophicus TaxID=500465 RepID=A0A5A8F361_9BACT|nr:hypothetical protein [Deferribacter autotrophicus]KAA0257971.1 hypothetical protein FHQ18_06150 [Deferribacter autotrophicus]